MEVEQVEQQVEGLLSGQGSEVTGCDVGLEQSKPATLRKNVTYIVCAVVFNEKEEVLMVQEAKQKCYKQWYLPAGRVEVGESLEEALRREVRHTHPRTYTHTHTHTCTRIHMHRHTHARTHTRTHTHVFTCTYTRTHMRTRTNIHTHMHRHTRTHTHTHQHTHPQTHTCTHMHSHTTHVQTHKHTHTNTHVHRHTHTHKRTRTHTHTLVTLVGPQVKEEAGFDCEPITLLLIQEQGPQWIRFIFLAHVTGGSLKTPSAADQESLQASWWDRQSVLPLRGRDILRLIDSGLKYRRDPWHPITLPVDLSCRHVVQRLVLVYTGPEQQIWVLLIKAPVLHLPAAAAVKTHTVTWAANMVVQDAMPAAYLDHDVNTLGAFSLQHGSRQHEKTDGVCFNTLVALVPDHVRRNEDGEKVERVWMGQPPPVENPRYVWHQVQKPSLREKLLEKTKNTSILPIHSMY
ncbi:8-oxo-dGDP phosphatase NUDT18 isoform X1 [Pseudoliparis swirei]|uniref:8-oxo-dGDP phosphatase NUDT18 isoform X1 n=1 Tax=Pseudoliparis swirei TaxID=2059687 RepID=UPI0024BDD976|nr:8-oxo-dGDP phosphatase NUDT18 isoform X1 [Pseudoliparis swirei]